MNTGWLHHPRLAYVVGLAVTILGSTCHAKPSIALLPGNAYAAQCSDTGMAASTVTVIPLGLEPERKYEILVVSSLEKFRERFGRGEIEAGATIFTRSQRKSSYSLEDIWPGSYDVLLVDKSARDASLPFLRGEIVHSKPLTLASPQTVFGIPKNIEPNRAFKIFVRSGVGPRRRGRLTITISPHTDDGTTGQQQEIRRSNISPCSSAELLMEGLAVGRYDVRLLQDGYGKEEFLLGQAIIAVGGAVEDETITMRQSDSASDQSNVETTLEGGHGSGVVWGVPLTTGHELALTPDDFTVADEGSLSAPTTTMATATASQIENARRFWIHGTLSSNIYGGVQLSIPLAWQQIDTSAFDGLNGFFAQTWLNQQTGEVILVFRGTESASDWGNNMFPGIVTSPQEEIAKTYAETIRTWFPNAKLTATGHSLGGALAKSAVEGTNDHAVVFNSSPRGPDGENITYIEETGDFLDAARLDGDGAISYNFLEAGRIESHGMFSLANGLRSLSD